MDDLESLELLSLVNKVASELHNHLGLSDKTLAEFIIDLARRRAPFRRARRVQSDAAAALAADPDSPAGGC